jgi:acyl carrier protein
LRAWLATAVLAFAGAPCGAGTPVPEREIVDTIRMLAAQQIGVKAADIDTISSLAAQGFREKDLHELVVAIEGEFRIVVPDDELRQMKWNDPIPAVSVRLLAQMVARHMREEP